MSRPGFIAAAVLAFGFALPSVAPGATITVDTLADSSSVDGRCSLREAVQSANADAPANAGSGECIAGAGADVIVMPEGTLPLEAGLGDLSVTADVTLRGAGRLKTTIQAQGTRAFTIGALQPPSVTLEGLAITGAAAPNGTAGSPQTGTAGGSGQDGGPATGGTGNPGGNGGAVFNGAGTLTILDCGFLFNNAGAGGSGGSAVGGHGGLGGAGGDAGGGTGGSGGSGGAVYSLGPVIVRDSEFRRNAAGRGGDGGNGSGGIPGAPATSSSIGRVGGSGHAGAGGVGGSGGAIASAGSVTVERTVFDGNASGMGGFGAIGSGQFGGGGGASAGAGGAGGAGHGGSGGDSGGGASIAGLASEPILITSSSLFGSEVGQAGGGSYGLGGGGGASHGPGAAGGFGGNGTGGDGGDAGDGAAVRTGGTIEVEASVVARAIGGTGGYGGTGTGGKGGNASGAGSPGGTGAAGTGGAGGRGGWGALNAAGAITLLNTTLDLNFWAGGGGGGTGQSALGGSGTSGAGLTGAAFGGAGGPAGIAVVYTGASFSARSITASSNLTGGSGPGGSAEPAAGGSATPGAQGGPSPGTFKAAAGTLTASLLAGNGAPACANALTDGGYNLQAISPAEVPGGSCPGTVVDDLQLASLGDFGGPTFTRRPESATPIDVVPVGATCPATDQRGVPRPRGSSCDAGAYERAAPAAVTGPADGVAQTTAELHGTANPNGPEATIRFEYGTSDAYGAVTPDEKLAAGLTDVAASAALSALQPGTTYHYRLVATTADGTAAGADAMFATPSGGLGTEDGDRTAPVLLAAAMRPRAFAVRRKGARRGGARLSWRLSEPATIVVKIARAAKGRRSGGRCVAPTRRLARARRCTRYRTIGAFTVRNSAAGPGSRPFTGRLGKRVLRRGGHRATLVATDAAGNKSAPRRVGFRVLRRRAT